MQYRHEIKHEISYGDMLIIRQRLSAVTKKDSHSVNGKYFIRSLYFDTLSDKALKEKIDGVNIREKFRIRYYNNDYSFIRLEKKSKINGLCLKESATLSKEKAKDIVNNYYNFLINDNNPLINEFLSKIKFQGLMPKTIVDYTREAFTFAPGNVRITLDYNIRTGMSSTDFLNPNCITVPAAENSVILEVKWDNFLPDIIRDIVQLENCHSTAFSKYAVCRRYD